VYGLAKKYGFHQCAVFVSHKAHNDCDECQAQSNCVSDGMIEHIEDTVLRMRQHLEEFGPDEE
jgi:hypothetical protein